VLGLARLGFLANFLSHPVMSGFTTAAVLVIALSQVKHVLGVPIEGMPRSHEVVLELVRRAPDTNLAALAIGVGTVALLLLFRRPRAVRLGLRPGWPTARPGGLVALVAARSSSSARSRHDGGSAGRGRSPGCAPDAAQYETRAPPATALAICLVRFSRRTPQDDAPVAPAEGRRQPGLLALGGANVAAALTGGYPVTGGLARSTVNFAAGAVTPLASILTALLVAVVVAFLTPLLRSLPQAVLAAIIIVALTNLVVVPALRRVWRYSKADGLAMTATFATSLLLPVQWGILIGTAIALLLYLWRTSQPHVAVLGRVGTSEHFRNVLRHRVETDSLVIRVDENLYFPNAKFLGDTLLRAWPIARRCGTWSSCAAR
jgi:SulP family sulfate permease